MTKTILAILLALCGALPAAAEDEPVFYDFIEPSRYGESSLSGGAAFREASPELAAKNIRAAAVPPRDGFYHIRFVADPAALDFARRFEEMLLFHPAFMSVSSRFRVEYAVGDPDRMNCGNITPAAPRLLTCDSDYIASLSTVPVHLTAVFTSRGIGGTGGRMPIASIRYPLSTMLHEMLHAWKLQDEYTYSQTEAEYYCRHAKILRAANTVSISTGAPFLSDGAARERFGGEIPWIMEIQSNIPITAPAAGPEDTGAWLVLGTPEVITEDEPGLYSGGNCSRLLGSFRPYKRDTIMKSLETVWIPPIHRDAVLAEIALAAGW